MLLACYSRVTRVLLACYSRVTRKSERHWRVVANGFRKKLEEIIREINHEISMLGWIWVKGMELGKEEGKGNEHVHGRTIA